MEFAEVIRSIRGDKTQAEFGKRIGVTNAAVSLYESGQRPPDRVICALLHVTTPEQQAIILEALGMDVQRYDAAILASAGVTLVEVVGTVGSKP